MLSIADLDPHRSPDYYLARSKIEYLQGDGADGLWYGRGATALGLSGKVGEKEFRSLFHGFLHGRKLVQNAGTKNHIAGKDFAFSAPKSVSALWAVADPETRAVIESCQLRAVKKALSYLEETATKVRVGKDGRERESAGMVATIWMHGSSRREEPALHHHATVFGLAVTPDSKTRSTVHELYFFQKMAAGAAYRAELARLLEKELGLQIYRPTQMMGTKEEKKSTFEIAGVPQSLADRWSTRSKEIAEEVSKKGLVGAVGKAIAALSTRQVKSAKPMTSLFPRWREEAREHHFTQQSVKRGPAPVRDEAKETREAVAIAVEKVTQLNSHFAERDLVKEVATEAQGRGLGFDQVRRAVWDTLDNSSEVMRLGTVKSEPRYTTKQVFRVEAALVTQVEAARGKNAHTVRESNVRRAIREAQAEATKRVGSKVELTAEQTSAVQRLTSGQDQIAVVTGDFSTGKRLVAATAVRAFELAGYHVLQAGGKSSVERLLKDLDLGLLDEAAHHVRQIGRAFTRTIYEDLKNTPILKRFVPRGKNTYQYDPARVDSKTVVFVTAAEGVSVKQLDDLTAKVTERGGKVCLVGNPSGGDGPQAFATVSRILGSANLTHNFRTKSTADQKALRALARGEAKDALQSYASRGLVQVEADQTSAMRQMVADFAKEGVRKPKENLLVCSTTQERTVLNHLAQAARKEAGKLGRKSVRIGSDDFHTHDRIAFQKRASYLGIESGATGEVLRIGRRRITRKTFHGKQFRSLWSMLKYAEKVKKDDKTTYLTVRLDTGKVVEVPLDRYGPENIRLGYAVRAGEAPEVDNAYVLVGPTTSREQLAGQLSRSRNAARIYTDRHTAGDRLECLAKSASRSISKELAHDVLDRHQGERLQVQR